MDESYSSGNGNNGGRILRGHWRPEEDEKLRQLVLTYGAKNWNSIAKSIEGRTGKSCRLRWFNQLNPMIKKGPFSKEEEERLIEAHKTHGNKWSTIASMFPGRTDNALKNHYHVVTARKRREEMRSPRAVGSSCYSDTRFQNTLMNRSYLRGYGISYPLQYSVASSSSWKDESLRKVSGSSSTVPELSNSSSFGFFGLRIGGTALMDNDKFVLNKPREFLSSWMATSSRPLAPLPYTQTTRSMEGNLSLFVDSNSVNEILGEGSSTVGKDAPVFIDFLGVGDN